MTFKALFITYLDAYSAKNIEVTSRMFANDIHLRDWKISVYGKDAAVAETSKNFASADSIGIEILHMHESESTVVGELKITVNQSEVLFVVDVVSFNQDGLIQSIRAYLGRGD